MLALHPKMFLFLFCLFFMLSTILSRSVMCSLQTYCEPIALYYCLQLKSTISFNDLNPLFFTVFLTLSLLARFMFRLCLFRSHLSDCTSLVSISVCYICYSVCEKSVSKLLSYLTTPFYFLASLCAKIHLLINYYFLNV